MSQITNPMYRPIITGKPEATRPATTLKPQASPGTSFQELLQKTLQKEQTSASELTFSRHAQARTMERGITLDDAQMDRLGQAVVMAEDKGLTDTLVMMDSNAFIVNVPNRVVITVVGGNGSENTVFTNIDGAVII